MFIQPGGFIAAGAELTRRLVEVDDGLVADRLRVGRREIARLRGVRLHVQIGLRRMVGVEVRGL